MALIGAKVVTTRGTHMVLISAANYDEAKSQISNFFGSFSLLEWEDPETLINDQYLGMAELTSI